MDIFTLYSLAAEHAGNAIEIETDIPLVIQGFVMIALAAIPLFLSGRDKRKSDEEENRHDEHMAQLIVSALKDEHKADETEEKEEGK